MSRLRGEVPMNFRNGTFPKSTVCVASYLAGVVTVAVLCCETDTAWYETIDHASAVSASDGGEEQSPVLSNLAFVFYKTEGIAGVTASVAKGGSEETLGNFRLYRTDGALVVETQAELDRNFRPRFYFLNREGKVVEQYRANVFVDHSLMTFDYQRFGENEQTPYYSQPDEIQVDVGETAEITLEAKNRFWVDGQFVDLWQIVHLPTEAQPSASGNCKLLNLNLPSKSVGIISDGTPGETVSLEVLP